MRAGRACQCLFSALAQSCRPLLVSSTCVVAGDRNVPTATASAPLQFRLWVLLPNRKHDRLNTVLHSAVDDPVLSMLAQGATVSLA